MIKKFSISNFKCFKEQSFELNKLNVFTGYNGRGKSSVIQALLMLAQSVGRYADIKTLSVNGNFVSLDLFSDLLFDNNPISFSIESTEETIKNIKLQYEQDEKNKRTGKLCGLYIDGENFSKVAKAFISTDKKKERMKDKITQFDKYNIGAIQKLFQNFYYISADRLGPTRFEEKKELDILNPIGINGQAKLNILSENNDLLEKVETNIRYIMDTDDRLELSSNSASVIELYFSNNNKKIKAINTGFGYSYILSIVLLLNYVESGVIFIENPEAHLHPLAQSRLMELICKMLDSKDNLQVYIETHSEHIINAIRLASIKKELKLNNENISIYFFDKDFSVKELEITNKGQILQWPTGFFDQQAKDLSEIIRLGLKN